MSFLLLPLLFFVISLIYSSAGFGGGSMYLAILSGAVFTLVIPQGEIKTLALLCNAAVATYSSIQFIRTKFIDWKPNILLLAFSIQAIHISNGSNFYSLSKSTNTVVGHAFQLYPNK